LHHLAGDLSARESRWDADAEVMRIGPVHLKRERGLRVRQLPHAAARNGIKVSRISRRHGVPQRRVRLGNDQAVNGMWKALGEAPDGIRVPGVVAVGVVRRHRKFLLEQRRFVPDLVRVGDALVRLPRSQLFGRHVYVADGERRCGRDGRKSSCLREEFPTICERQMAARHGSLSFRRKELLRGADLYAPRWFSSTLRSADTDEVSIHQSVVGYSWTMRADRIAVFCDGAAKGNPGPG